MFGVSSRRKLSAVGSLALVAGLLGAVASVGVGAPASADGSLIQVQPQTYTVIEDGFLNIAAPGVLTGATDGNTGVGPLTAAAGSVAPSDGTLVMDSSGDGGFQYTPDAGFVGTDTFTYTASDGTYTSSEATVTIDVVDPIATKTAIISENPPASDPGTSVTFTAEVTPGGAGPALTGSVSFSYLCSGSGCSSRSGTLGSSPIGSNDQASVTTSGQLPVGVDTITATYSGDSNYSGSSGSVIYTVDATCNENPWPSETNGYPAVEASGPTGFYIGQSNGWWTVYTETDTNRGKGGTKFTGTVTTKSARFLDVSALKNESTDSVKLIGNNKIVFKFATHLSLDSFTFYVGCGNDVTFHLSISKIKAPPSEIFVGNPTTNPASNPVTYNR